MSELSTSHSTATSWRLVGVLGGMGPLASVLFLKRLVELTGAAKDQDHARLIFRSEPDIPDRTNYLCGDGDDPWPQIERGLNFLLSNGAEVIALPCNTATVILRLNDTARRYDVVDPICSSIARLREEGPVGRVGLLGTSGTIRSGMYQRELERSGYEWAIPTYAEQSTVDHAIASIKGGDLGNHQTLLEVVRKLGSRDSCDCLILACTELQALPPHIFEGFLTIDSAEATALATLANARL